LNRPHVGYSSNLEWRCTSAVQSIAYDAPHKKVFITEADEGKLTTLDVVANGSQLKYSDQMRVQKLKTLLKGVEDSRLLSVIPLDGGIIQSPANKLGNWLALELVQPNCQTYVLFMDRLTGSFQGAYHYPREIKSGFIYLDERNLDRTSARQVAPKIAEPAGLDEDFTAHKPFTGQKEFD